MFTKLKQLVRDMQRDLSTVAASSGKLNAVTAKLDKLVKGNAKLDVIAKKLDRVARNTGRPVPKPSVWFDMPPNSNVSLFKALSDAALARTVDIVHAEMSGAMLFRDTDKFHKFCLDAAAADGTHCEFGVYSGKTINRFAGWRPAVEFIGFDSFRGLPEEWHGWQTFDFAMDGNPPQVNANVRLEIGLFSETLPRVAPTLAPLSFLHVDCDLYSSTVEIFTNLGDKIAPGCVIVFDEYFCYPNFEQHEYKAFAEFLAKSGRKATWIALCGQRAACTLD